MTMKRIRSQEKLPIHSISFGLKLISCLISTENFANAEDPLLDPSSQPYVQGELLVQFKSQSIARARDQSLFRQSILRMNDLDQKGLSRVLLLNDQSVENALSVLRNDPTVEYAQPNYLYKITTTSPDDAKYSSQWGLKNIEQTMTSIGGQKSPISPTTGIRGNDIGAESAWDYITDCSSILVAILDTGVNYTHDDLINNLWDGGTNFPKHGFNFVNGNTDSMDNHGHGTHVAGIIGAEGNNGSGIAGVCWQAQIMAVKVMDAVGNGTTSTITQGLNFAVQNGAKIINLSVGGQSFDPAFNSAIANAAKKGAIVVAAAGNNGTDNDDSSTPVYPCNYNQPNIICVAALDPNYSLTYFSNYGANTVTTAAPGLNIASPYTGIRNSYTPTYTGWSTNVTYLSGYEFPNASSPTSNWAGSTTKFSTSNTYVSSSGTGTSISTLVNPTTYDHTHTYANGSDDHIFRAFSLTPTPDIAILNYSAIIDTEAGHDGFYVAYRKGSGDPFISGSGTTIAGISGTTNNTLKDYSYDISPCIDISTDNCTVGFRLQSDTQNNNFGVAVGNISINTLIYRTNSYEFLSGTSMATPFVTGIAALVMAYNPNYTYKDVINSIKNGGVYTSSLSQKTISGRAAHAMGSLSYIAPPTGIKATPQ